MGRETLRYGVDFVVEPLKKRHGQRKKRKPSSTVEESMVMDNQAPPSPEQSALREYWRSRKREQRARAKPQ